MIRSTLLTVLVSASLAIVAQPTNYALSGSAQRQTAIDLGGGNTFFACWRTDITGAELMWADQNMVVTNARSYQLLGGTMFMNDAGRTDDGYLVGGHLLNRAYVLKTDADGDLQSLDLFTNLGHSQDQVIAILGRESNFSLYTYPGGTFNDGVYRIEGSITDTTYTGVEIVADSAYFRIYDAVALADPTQHLLAGTGYNIGGSFNLEAALLQVNDTGGVWMNLYDMDTTSSSTQDVMAVVPVDGGGHLCAGPLFSGSTLQSFVLKVDASGAVVWARRYIIPGSSIRLTAIIELANGDLLAAGQDNTNTGLLLRLSTTGAIVWQRRFTAGGGGPSFQDGFYFTDQDDLKLSAPHWSIGLDPEGNGCGFLDIGSIETTLLDPVVTPMVLTNTPVVPTTMDGTHAVLTPSMTWTIACTDNSIEEMPSAGAISAYPVPTNGLVFLGEAGQVGPAERVLVRDLVGALLYNGPYHQGVDLGGLNGGCYVIELAGSHRHALAVRE